MPSRLRSSDNAGIEEDSGYFQAAHSPKGLCRVFNEHIQRGFCEEHCTQRVFDQTVSPYWCAGADDFIQQRVKEEAEYKYRLRKRFNRNEWLIDWSLWNYSFVVLFCIINSTQALRSSALVRTGTSDTRKCPQPTTIRSSEAMKPWNRISSHWLKRNQTDCYAAVLCQLRNLRAYRAIPRLDIGHLDIENQWCWTAWTHQDRRGVVLFRRTYILGWKLFLAVWFWAKDNKYIPCPWSFCPDQARPAWKFISD